MLPIPSLWTVAVIAESLAIPARRVERLMAKLGIRPSALAGPCRVYRSGDVERLRAELRQ